MERTFSEWVAVLRWADGDTFYGVLDCGNRIFLGDSLVVRNDHIEIKPVRQRCALIQAPELSKPGGTDALEYARALVLPGLYPCTTYKAPEEYGRPLIDLQLPAGMFSALMLGAGHAKPYK